MALIKLELKGLHEAIKDLRTLVSENIKDQKAVLEKVPIHEERIASLKMAIIGVYTVLGTVGAGVAVYALTK